MSNSIKYIKDLEAAGFERKQAEAQVQMVLDVLEGDLVTKSDFAVFEERNNNRFLQLEQRMVELELRLLTRLGVLIVGTGTIGVAILTWLIKM